MKLYIGNWQWITNKGPAHWGFPAGLVAGLDMRPLAEQAMQGGQGGLGIFAGDINDSAYDMIGRGDEAVTKQAKAAIAKRFKVAPQGDTLADCLHSLMMAGDPRGELSHKPLLPTRGFTEIHICGKLKSNPFAWGDAGTSAIRDVLQSDFRKQFEADQSHAKKVLGFLEDQYKFKGAEWRELVPQDLRGEVDGPRKPETTITDNFTRADGAAIGNLLTWTKTAGTWTTVSNQIDSGVGASVGNCRAESDLSSSDHYAQALVTSLGSGANQTLIGPTCRFNSSAITYYGGFPYQADDNIYINKAVSTTYTNLTNAAITLAIPEIYKIYANGSAIKAYQAGVERLSITDTSITGNTRGGFQSYDVSSAHPTLDDFEASDLAASGLLYTQLEKATRGMMRGMWTGYGG